MKSTNQTNLRGIIFSTSILMMLLTQSSYSRAQNARTITGTVQDAKGLPLSGASVVVKGTANGTSTDASGKYFLSVSGSNLVLVFSYAGFQNKEVAAKNLTTIDVALAE